MIARVSMILGGIKHVTWTAVAASVRQCWRISASYGIGYRFQSNLYRGIDEGF